jgi:hypothetical protein
MGAFADLDQHWAGYRISGGIVDYGDCLQRSAKQRLRSKWLNRLHIVATIEDHRGEKPDFVGIMIPSTV